MGGCRVNWFRCPTFSDPLVSQLSWEEKGMLCQMIEAALQANDPQLSEEWISNVLGIHRKKSAKIYPKFQKILRFPLNRNFGMNFGSFCATQRFGG